MKKAGLKPILGTTLSFSFLKKEKLKGEICLFVLNKVGYRNLSLILSAYSMGTLSVERLIELQAGVVLMLSPDHPELSQANLDTVLKPWKRENLFVQIYRFSGAPPEAPAVAAAERLSAKCV